MEKFRAAAMKFVEHVDAAPQIEANAFLKNVGRSMAELYSVALSLPAVEPETTGADEAPFQTDKLDELRRSLHRKPGSLDIYWQIFDSTQKKNQCKGVCQETSPKFILTSSRALKWQTWSSKV